MSKKRVTFHRMVTGVESVTMVIDGDIDLNAITSEEAFELVDKVICNDAVIIDVELIENEYPHAVTCGRDYLDFAEING